MKYNCYEINFQYKLKENDEHLIRYDEEFSCEELLDAFDVAKKCMKKASEMCENDGFDDFNVTIWYYDDKGCIHDVFAFNSRFGDDWHF